MQRKSSTGSLSIWLVTFFLVVMGAKLWIIQLWGTNIPYWDQWDEAHLLFKPWVEGNLTWHDLFHAHNEHRIFFTRLLDLLELKLNSQWDPMLQMVVNAVIHTGYGCGLAYVLWRFIGKKHGALICALLLPFFVLPFAGENTTHGFQSQMYFLDIFSVAAILGLGFGKPCGAAWLGGLMVAVMAIFTMGSGFLAAVVVIGLVVLRMLKEHTITRGQTATILCALTVIALGWNMKVTVPHDKIYQAKSVWEFLNALLINLAWPAGHHRAMVLVFCMPLAITFVQYFRKDFKNPRGAEFVLAFGLWGILQASALAFARSSLADSSRYLDTLSMVPLASLACLFVLADSLELRSLPRWIVPLLAIAWGGILFGEMWHVSRTTMSGYLYSSRGWGVLETDNLRAFMATDNPNWLRSKMALAIPYWSSDRLLGMLRDPDILSILPPDARPPLKLEPATNSSAAFVPDGFAPDRPKQEFTKVWGDYSTNSTAAGAQFISQPISASLPKLKLSLCCGDGTNGVSARLVEMSGRPIELHPANTKRWQTLIVDAPRHPFRVEVKNAKSWVAVGGVKELGRFYPFVQHLLTHAALIFLIGLALGVLLAGYEVSVWGMGFANGGIVRLLVLLALFVALAGALVWRNFNATDYTCTFEKTWAAKYASVGEFGHARLHLREALWLRPDDVEAKKEMVILNVRDTNKTVSKKN